MLETIFMTAFLSSTHQMWYVVPLVLCISLVYAATHHEPMNLILRRAVRTFVWIIGFMLFAFFILYLMQRWV